MNNKTVFIWKKSKKWRTHLFSILNYIFDEEFRNLLLLNPPEDWNWYKVEWLDALLSKKMKNPVSINKIFYNYFINSYKAIQLYHLCRPIDFNTYYKEGIIPLNIEQMNKYAIEVFSKYISIDLKIIENILQENYFGLNHRCNKIFFCLDDRYCINTTNSSNHYLKYGSEYLQGIAVHINCNWDLKEKLYEIGLPAVFICNIPIEFLAEDDISCICQKMLKCVVIDFMDNIKPNDLNWEIDITIELDKILQPKYIVGHYHPEQFL